ncbi:MAG: hypothetical protein K0M56_11660 [Kaistella sp.]|nr:hypothetical protein [Kaistella sp.]
MRTSTGIMIREFGSDFHYVNEAAFRTVTSEYRFWEGADLFFSGRAALRAILLNGIREFHWKKLYVPSYYCHEVYHFIKDLPIVLEFYRVSPFLNNLPDGIDDRKENAILLVSYFGSAAANAAHLKNIIKIEDITHDLETLHTSTADYVFGSLRKELPVPVGGFVKSSVNIPALQWTLAAETAAAVKLSGMVLKRQYLTGDFDNKAVFRDLLIKGENSFENLDTHGALPVLVKDYLLSLHVENILKAKRINYRSIRAHLLPVAEFSVVDIENHKGFGLVMVFQEEDVRNSFRHYLIQHSIYPAVLWPGQLNPEDKMVENTILVIHTDFRYSEGDMQYISELINNFDANA